MYCGILLYYTKRLMEKSELLIQIPKELTPNRAQSDLPGALNLTPMTIEEKERVLYRIMDQYIENLPKQAQAVESKVKNVFLDYEFCWMSLHEAAALTSKRLQCIKERYQNYSENMNEALREWFIHTLFFLFFRGQYERHAFISYIAKVLGGSKWQRIEEFITEYGTSELVYMAPHLFEQFDLLETGLGYGQNQEGARRRIVWFFDRISRIQHNLFWEAGKYSPEKREERMVISTKGNPIITFSDGYERVHFEILWPVSQTKWYPIMKEFQERIQVKKAKSINNILPPNAFNPVNTALRNTLVGRLGIFTKKSQKDIENFIWNAKRPIVLDNRTTKDELYNDIKYYNPSVELDNVFSTRGDFRNSLLGLVRIERGLPTMPSGYFILSTDKDYVYIYNPNSQEIYMTDENNPHNSAYGLILFNEITKKEFLQHKKA